MGDEEVLDLLKLLDLSSVLLSEQTLGLILVLHTGDEQSLALLALDRLTRSRRYWAFLGCRCAVRLDFAGDSLLCGGIGGGSRLRCGSLGLLRSSCGCGRRSGACRLSALVLLLGNRGSGDSRARLLGSICRCVGRTSLSRRWAWGGARGSRSGGGGSGRSRLSGLTRRRNLSAAVCEVEALSAHLGTNPAIIDVKNEPAIGSIGKVEVPHILESALVDDTTLRPWGGATEGVTAVGDGGHLVHDLEGQVEQALLRVAIGDGRLDLRLDCIPDIVEGGLRCGKLAAVVVQSRVNTELVVGTAVAEVKASGNREVGLQCHGQLVQKTLTCGGSVGDEDAGFGRIVNAVCGVDQLAHLQKRRPHGTLTTCNCCSALTVVEQLVHDNGTAQAEQTQLYTANVK